MEGQYVAQSLHRSRSTPRRCPYKKVIARGNCLNPKLQTYFRTRHKYRSVNTLDLTKIHVQQIRPLKFCIRNDRAVHYAGS